MFTVGYDELLARIVAIEKELIPTCDAKPYALHAQEEYPYWTNGIEGIETTSNSQDLDVFVVTVNAFLIVASATAGYDGTPERLLRGYLGTVISGFNSREYGLQSAAYPAAMTHLTRARVGSVRALVITENDGIGANQVGAIFPIVCEFEVFLEQEY